MHENISSSMEYEVPPRDPVEEAMLDGEKRLYTIINSSKPPLHDNSETGDKIGREHIYPTEQKYIFSMVEDDSEIAPIVPVLDDEDGVFTSYGFEISGNRYPFREEDKKEINKAILKDYLRDANNIDEVYSLLDERSREVETFMYETISEEVGREYNEKQAAKRGRILDRQETIMGEHSNDTIDELFNSNKQLAKMLGIKAEDYYGKGLTAARWDLRKKEKDLIQETMIKDNYALMEMLGIADKSFSDVEKIKDDLKKYSRIQETEFYLDANKDIIEAIGLKEEEEIIRRYCATLRKNEKGAFDNNYGRVNGIENRIDTSYFDDILPLLNKASCKKAQKIIASNEKLISEGEQRKEELKEKDDFYTKDSDTKQEYNSLTSQIKGAKNAIKRAKKTAIRDSMALRYNSYFKEKTAGLDMRNVSDSEVLGFQHIPERNSIYNPYTSAGIYRTVYAEEYAQLQDEKKAIDNYGSLSEEKKNEMIHERFESVMKKIADTLAPEGFADKKEIFFFPTCYVVTDRNIDTIFHDGSPLDKKILDAFESEAQKDKWCEYWRERVNESDLVVRKYLNSKAINDVSDKKSEYEKEVVAIYENNQFSQDPPIDNVTGKINDYLQPRDIETLNQFLPLFAPFIKGIDFSEIETDLTLKATRLNIMSYLSGSAKSGNSLICSEDGSLRIRNLENLIENTEEEKIGRVAARVSAALGTYIHASMKIEDRVEFSSYMGDKSNISKTDFYRLFEKHENDPAKRRSIIERTLFLKAFTSYFKGTATEEMKEFIEKFAKKSVIGSSNNSTTDTFVGDI